MFSIVKMYVGCDLNKKSYDCRVLLLFVTRQVGVYRDVHSMALSRQTELCCLSNNLSVYSAVAVSYCWILRTLNTYFLTLLYPHKQLNRFFSAGPPSFPLRAMKHF